ncbi:MAG: chemotaxis protein CheW [Myxococcota bacterium]
MSGFESHGDPGAAAPRADWQSLARAAAGNVGDEAEAEILRELLTFRLADSPYAVPVERVREIVRLRTITPVPRVPSSVLGVIALRGEIVQVVDLRMRLGLATPDPSRSSRVIVLHGDDDRVTGVLVDQVREVLRVSEESFRPATSGESASVTELCVRGEEFISVIDLDRVLEIDAV